MDDGLASCPICGRPIQNRTTDEAKRLLPFCGSRCKLIDLGAWLNERYYVPVPGAVTEAEGVEEQ